MSMMINTNQNSLTAQNNVRRQPERADDGDHAPVFGPAHQQCRRRRRRPRHLGPHDRPGQRPEPGGPQRQRRHLAGADRRRRAVVGQRQPAANPRARGAVGERDELVLGPCFAATRSCRSCSRKSTASRRRRSSTAPTCSTARSRTRPSRSAPTSARPSRSPRSPRPAAAPSASLPGLHAHQCVDRYGGGRRAGADGHRRRRRGAGARHGRRSTRRRSPRRSTAAASPA